MAGWDVTSSYSFIHALYQQVLVHRLSPVWKLRLQQRIGERLEAAYGEQTNVVAAELALHFEQGRVYARALHYLWQAAEYAARRYANREARLYLTHAPAQVDKLSGDEQVEARLALLEHRGAVSRAMGDMLARIKTASEMAERNGHQRWVLLLWLNRAWLDVEAENFGRAHDVCTHRAQSYWQRSKATVLCLADSFAPGEPLRQTFLAQPQVAEALQRS